MGKVAWNKGKTGIYSKESLEKMSRKAKERWKDPQYRNRMCKAFKGRIPWNKGKKLPPLSLEHRRKISDALKRKAVETSLRIKKLWQDPKCREKMLKARRRIKMPEEELRRLYLDERLSTQKIAELYGCSRNAVVKRLRAYGIKLRTAAHPQSEEFKQRQSLLLKKRWSNPAFRRKRIKNIFQSLAKKPTKPEQRVIELIEVHNIPFHYVGDGKAVIGSLCPDFIHNNGERTVIEIFGRTYHDPSVSFRDEIPWHQQYWGRMAYFAQLGYDCLILWDDELDDETEVVEKIEGFTNG